MPLEEFLGNLSGRRDESGKLVDAKSYIKAHRNDDDFSFENVKMISTALQHDDTPYSKEEALLLGIEAVGKNKALQQKLAEGYTGQLRGAEEIGAVAGLLLSEQVLPQGKKIIADYLQKNRSEDTVEYFATLLPVRQTEAIQAIAELNTGLRDAMIIRQAGAGVAETSSLPTEEEARLFQRAVRYEDGNPAAAKDFLATKTTQQKFKEGIVQIIQERRFQEKEVTYADIATMVSNAPLPVQTIETFGRGIAPSKLKVEDVIPFALRTFAGEETRAVGGAGAAEDNPGLFIKGLDLSQDQVLSLGGDPSMPKEYLGKIIAQDPDNMAANALEIGKARTDLSFKDVKDLVPEGTPSKKEDAEIFRELAIARAENPESAKKLVEDLTLDQVAQYSKDGGLDLRATGMMMREVNDVMPEALETCYIEALATANIGEIPAQSERFEVFKQNAANIAGSSLDSPQKFSLGAKAILHGKEDKAEIIQQICEGASLSQDEKLELLSAGEVHNFKKAWEITSVASDQKSEFFLKFAKKFGDKAELGEMGVSDFEGVDIKGFALNGSLPERMSKDIAGIILANAEAKRGLTQGERVKLERLNKGADLTPKEYFNHALDHAIIRNKGKEVEDLLDKLDRQDRSAKLKFIDDLNAKHPELKIQVKKSLGERFSLGLRRIWPFGKGST